MRHSGWPSTVPITEWLSSGTPSLSRNGPLITKIATGKGKFSFRTCHCSLGDPSPIIHSCCILAACYVSVAKSQFCLHYPQCRKAGTVRSALWKSGIWGAGPRRSSLLTVLLDVTEPWQLHPCSPESLLPFAFRAVFLSMTYLCKLVATHW